MQNADSTYGNEKTAKAVLGWLEWLEARKIKANHLLTTS
jgi:hypothetical protein